MTFEEFQTELKKVVPSLFNGEKDLEILISDGYCQVLYSGHVIGSSDEHDKGGWGVALAEAIEWFKEEMWRRQLAGSTE